MAERLSEGWKAAIGGHTANPDKARDRGNFPLVIKGVKYPVSSCEVRIKAQFEEWVQENQLRAIDAIEEKRPEKAQKMLEQFGKDISSGSYAWNGECCVKARQGWPGAIYLFYLLLNRCNKDITPEVAEEIFTNNNNPCALAIGWALGNSLAPTEDEALVLMKLMEGKMQKEELESLQATVRGETQTEEPKTTIKQSIPQPPNQQDLIADLQRQLKEAQDKKN